MPSLKPCHARSSHMAVHKWSLFPCSCSGRSAAQLCTGTDHRYSIRHLLIDHDCQPDTAITGRQTGRSGQTRTQTARRSLTIKLFCGLSGYMIFCIHRMISVAGLNPQTPVPTELKLHRKSGVLSVTFNDGKAFNFPCEFLRVYSPSAEVRGHEPGQEILQTGKKM